MEGDARRRLIEAVEQARARAAEVVSEIGSEQDAPRAVESAVREAEEALTRLVEKLKADG